MAVVVIAVDEVAAADAVGVEVVAEEEEDAEEAVEGAKAAITTSTTVCVKILLYFTENRMTYF